MSPSAFMWASSRVMAERSAQRYSAKAVRLMGTVKVRLPAASAWRAR